MERKTTKMLALVAVIGLCAVALIGAAYAAFAGTASTYNEGNSSAAGYMTLTPAGDANSAAKWAAITTAAAEFSTYHYAIYTPAQEQTPASYVDKTAYYFANNSGVTDGTGVAANYKVKLVGDVKSFTITNKTGAAITAINFKATADVAPAASDFKYFLKVTIGETVTYLDISTTQQETTAKTLAIGIDGTASISVGICVGYDPNVTLPSPLIGEATSGQNDDARESASAPAGLAATSFAFSIVDAS